MGLVPLICRCVHHFGQPKYDRRIDLKLRKAFEYATKLIKGFLIEERLTKVYAEDSGALIMLAGCFLGPALLSFDRFSRVGVGG